MFLQEDRKSAGASTIQLIFVHSSKEWIELHTRMSYLRSELNRAQVGDVEAAVRTYRQITLDVDKHRNKEEFVSALKGSAKERMSAIRELGGLFDRAQGDDNQTAIIRRLLFEIGTDTGAPPNLAEMFVQAQRSPDLLDSATATLVCTQVGLSEDQARRRVSTCLRHLEA